MNILLIFTQHPGPVWPADTLYSQEESEGLLGGTGAIDTGAGLTRKSRIQCNDAALWRVKDGYSLLAFSPFPRFPFPSPLATNV